VGQQVEKYLDITRRMDREGHLPGNHSWDHPEGLIELKSGKKRSAAKPFNKKFVSMKPPLVKPRFKEVNGTGHSVENEAVADAFHFLFDIQF
jgi:hypothetical protein